jgi:hypothetical protein
MRFLHRLGSVFFAKCLSWILDVRLGDSLCGTTLLTQADYQRLLAWRRDFGDFDPFGDFELLFPAAVLGLGIVDIPIRYLARTYGSINIHRFSIWISVTKNDCHRSLPDQVGIHAASNPLITSDRVPKDS